jgi:hypothetical protein
MLAREQPPVLATSVMSDPGQEPNRAALAPLHQVQQIAKRRTTANASSVEVRGGEMQSPIPE